MTEDPSIVEAVPERPLLRGKRVWLRPLEERDLPAYVAGINDAEVGGMAGYRVPLSIEQARGWLGEVREKYRTGEGYYFAVCELGDDRFIGTVWLKNVSVPDANGELAVYMDHRHIGAGWGSDAVRVLLAFAFRNVGMERVYLTTFAGNARAIRAYEKVGFIREGLMRRAWRSPRGLEDNVLMAILRDEWEASGA